MKALVALVGTKFPRPAGDSSRPALLRPRQKPQRRRAAANSGAKNVSTR